MRQRYGHSGRAVRGVSWTPGDRARTTVKIPGDPPVFPPVAVTVEEVQTFKPSHHKDSFGHRQTTHHEPRARVTVDRTGKTYWVDANTLERT